MQWTKFTDERKLGARVHSKVLLQKMPLHFYDSCLGSKPTA